MELHYKTTTVILLLLLHSSQMGCQNPAVTEPPGYTTDENWYQDSGDHTDSIPVRTIDPEWLRVKPVNGGIEREVSSGESAMSISSGEGSGMAVQDQDNATVLSTMLSVQNDTAAKESVSAETTTLLPTTAAPTTGPAEQVNVTGAEEGGFQGSTTTHPPTGGFPHLPNDTDLNDTAALTPETNVTQGPSSETNSTEHAADVTTTEGPVINVESTTLTTTDLPPPETTTEGALNSTTVAPDTPEAANMTDKYQASGTNSERGSSGMAASETKRSRRSEAWSAILGTGVAVAFVAMVVYVIVRKRKQRDFSHRKLVEEFPADPVLRLDNSEPMDLNFGGSAYYNRAMEADDIQMNSFSGGQQH